MDFVTGDHTGLKVPTHGGALIEAGAEYLTQAFAAFNPRIGVKVTRIDDLKPCPGGSTGKKFFIDLEYDGRGIPKRLFVKFSRDFDDTSRDDRGKYEMESEVAFTHLSALDDFPIRVPRSFFADYDSQSHSGLLITECIPFGDGMVEPQHGKCMDHQLPDPLAYYLRIVDALGTLAGVHRAGRLGPLADHYFPHDPARLARSVGLRTHATEAQLIVKIERFRSFAAEHPLLLPRDLIPERTFDELRTWGPRFIERQQEIADYLTSRPAMIAFCHWNANIDNCWFWRDEAQDLNCGLLDWGNAGQINHAFALWGCLSSAPGWLWNEEHLDVLLRTFGKAFEAQCNETICRHELRTHLDLYIAMMGLTYFLDSPSRIESALSTLGELTGPFDDQLLKNDRARNQLFIATNFLNYWRRFAPYKSLELID